MKMLELIVALLALSGVLTDSSNWAVFYPEKNICAVRGFSATLPCNYSYPQSRYKVVQILWCLMNSKFCENSLIVYNSSSKITSDFVYGGDDKSNCTLFIQNVKFNYSGEYRFRFITNVSDGKWSGHPGVNLTVSDLKVKLIRLSGNGTLKPGDSLNLTCHVNCTHSSSQIVWSKNNQNLNRSGPVLHFPNLTVEDSGNYTCTWRTNVTSGSDTISIYVEGGNWVVFYPGKNICAVRGFSVTLPCYYSYPQSGYKVVQMLWCSMNSNYKWCEESLYVYDSASNVTSDFVYGGDDKSNCTLFIQNVKFNYSGEYRFRFITDVTTGKYTGDPGVTLTVSDLKVELNRLSGNGTLKPGDSLNLTCHVNCTHSSSQFVWSKNNQNLHRSGPVLQFSNLTVEDSGSYTCTWNSSMSSGSDTISIQVEGGSISSGTESQWLVWIILGIGGGILILSVAAAVIYSRRRKKKEEKRDEEVNEDGVMNVQDDQQDDSVIYSDVKLH
ncbi:carcinoembryonic antigen-related cell adhesion molecule 1-like [Trichomycterus rosablanca]|uniref:carcinoembryonic antigen-related cell adhesion molecule 1-like n=1 Tax=Trichomycterus rosablanca TaxID=2290929 RepID=UPI002F35C124